MKKNIYLDHAATTYVKKEVLNEMMPYFSKKFGNPSAIYKLGDENKNIVNLARERVARALNAKPSEIYFTGCGSESDNWALKGIAFANKDKGNHIITTRIEHAAILKSCEFLETLGFEITYLSVDKYGRIDVDALKNAVKETTILISVMFANNEIGTIEPIKEIAKIAKEHNIYFHTDAVQAVGNVKIDVKELGVDMLSLSGHKLYGPKGIGVLYTKEGTNIENLIHGGGQELGKRAGTENVSSIVGLGKAMEIAYRDFDKNNSKILALREYFITEVEKRIPDVKLNGHRELRLPGNINFSFTGVDGGTLLEMLNLHGISASSGSACGARNVKPSHVLKAIGLDNNTIKSSLRFSLGTENTKRDIDYVLTILETEVKKLRKL